MGVLLQAFYWDCPAAEGCEGGWLRKIMARLPDLAADGFSALWLPPSSKAAEWNSMGYDPYDYFDLGEFNQKGRAETWFGSRQDLLDFIRAAHQNSLQVYADVVLNHNSGGDAQEVNPIDEESLDTLCAEERQVPSRLDMLSSQQLRDHGRLRKLRRHA